MIRIFFVFALLLASVLLGIQLSKDPGYLLITMNGWSLETTVWVALGALLILFFFIHTLLIVVHRLSHLPQSFADWRAGKRAYKAQTTTNQGLIEFSEGYWSSAKKHLIQALPNTEMPLLNYLTAARAAQEMGDHKLRDDYLRQAQQSMPDAQIAVELTQAQLQLANQQWEQALATLRHLQILAPHHPYVLKLLSQLYQEVRDWPQLIALLPELKRKQILTGTAFELLRHKSYLQAMKDLVRLSQTEALTELFRKLPKKLKDDPRIIACYCEFLIRRKEYTEAESILRNALRQHLHENLGYLYGEFYLNDKQMAFAESLEKKYPSSSVLALTMGRLCLAAELWGKARMYFEKSIALKPSAIAYTEIGKLMEKMGDQEAACAAYRKGLDLI